MENYQLEPLHVGHGSFATVYKARDRRTNEIVAVKVIEVSKLSSALQDRLRQEIRVMEEMSQLKHPNIVELKECIWEFGSPSACLVMEYCGGKDLDSYLRSNRAISEEQVRFFMAQLVSALELLHRHHFIHRDLKPANILLSHVGPDATIKLADFGFARALDSQRNAQTWCGSPYYMAPEVLARRAYNEKADHWSLGVIIYQLLTGKVPFDGYNPGEILAHIQASSSVLLPSTLSSKAVRLIQNLLQKDPSHRTACCALSKDPFFQGATAPKTPLPRPRSPHMDQDAFSSALADFGEQDITAAPVRLLPSLPSLPSLHHPSDRKKEEMFYTALPPAPPGTDAVPLSGEVASTSSIRVSIASESMMARGETNHTSSELFYTVQPSVPVTTPDNGYVTESQISSSGVHEADSIFNNMSEIRTPIRAVDLGHSDHFSVDTPLMPSIPAPSPHLPVHPMSLPSPVVTAASSNTLVNVPVPALNDIQRLTRVILDLANMEQLRCNVTALGLYMSVLKLLQSALIQARHNRAASRETKEWMARKYMESLACVNMIMSLSEQKLPVFNPFEILYNAALDVCLSAATAERLVPVHAHKLYEEATLIFNYLRLLCTPSPPSSTSSQIHTPTTASAVSGSEEASGADVTVIDSYLSSIKERISTFRKPTLSQQQVSVSRVEGSEIVV